MTYSLPAEFAAFVKSAVAAGEYDSPEAVVAAGLRLLRERREHDEYVRREVQKGLDELDRGEFIEITSERQMDEFFDDVRRRALERIQAEQANE